MAERIAGPSTTPRTDLPNGLADAVERAWQASQDWLVALLLDTRHVVVADSSHYIQVERPQVVVDALARVVDVARGPRSRRATWLGGGAMLTYRTASVMVCPGFRKNVR